MEITERSAAGHYLLKVAEEKGEIYSWMVYQAAIFKARVAAWKEEKGVDMPDGIVVAFASTFMHQAKKLNLDLQSLFQDSDNLIKITAEEVEEKQRKY